MQYKKKRQISFVEAIREGITQSLQKDKKLFLMGEGVDDPASMWGTIKNISKEFGKKREIGDSFYLKNFSEDLSTEEIFDKKLINSKSQYFADIASSLQTYLENFTLENIKQIKQENGDENLCYAGGVAYNSAINSKIIRCIIWII